jgi:pilus assembly protein CpaB
MKIAVICLVLFGLLAAICAAVLVAALTLPKDSATSKAAPAEELIEVLAATRDLQPMSVVDAASVVTTKIAKSQVPENALLNPVQVVGKVVTLKMVAGQSFTKACFAREGVGVYLASAVPPGKRAMSISLTDWSGMAGLLYPGGVVDVLVSFKTLGINGRQNETEMMATTLLQGLQVLAIGSQSVAGEEYKDKQAGALAQRGDMNSRMITLLVDPKQAEILQLASQSGSISLAMRNPLDKGQEVRRLTRAREIKPGGETTAALPADSDIDPFEVPAKRPGSDATIGSHSPDEWETTILRGKESQKRTFPMPLRHDSAHVDDAQATTQPAAAAIHTDSKDAGTGS